MLLSVIFWWYVIKFFIWLFKRESFPNIQENNKYNNKTKHACKCYMEGLTLSEQKVVDLLSQELSYEDYFLFNNIIIHSKNNISTQIDHIIVSKFGIFVLESKDLSGYIFGGKYQSIWTQSFRGAKKVKIQNPLHQNYGHVMALKELLPFAQDFFLNIVVLTGNAEIKTGRIENVILLENLIDCIKGYKQVVLNENQVQYAIGKLSYACQTINITEEEHSTNVRANKNYQKMNQYRRESFGSYYRPAVSGFRR